MKNMENELIWEYISQDLIDRLDIKMIWGFWLKECTIYWERNCRRKSKFETEGRALVQF